MAIPASGGDFLWRGAATYRINDTFLEITSNPWLTMTLLLTLRDTKTTHNRPVKNRDTTEGETFMMAVSAASKGTGKKRLPRSAKAKRQAAAMNLPVIGEGNNLWRRLKTLRDQMDIAQNEIAKALGVSRSAVTQWERNATQPSLAMIEKLAVLLKTTPEFLAFGLKEGASELGTVKIPIVEFGDKGKPEVTSHLGLDRPFVGKLGISNPQTLRAFAVMDDPGVTGIKVGDRVIYDAEMKRISTNTPVAMMVHGEPRVAVATMLPSSDKHPKARVTMGGLDHDLTVEQMQLLGRVVSIIHQSN